MISLQLVTSDLLERVKCDCITIMELSSYQQQVTSKTEKVQLIIDKVDHLT